MEFKKSELNILTEALLSLLYNEEQAKKLTISTEAKQAIQEEEKKIQLLLQRITKEEEGI